MIRKENAQRELGVSNKAYINSDYKRFPAYGKQLMETRLSGKVPSKMVMVVFDWELAKAYPSIVVPNGILPKELNFNYLAGLPVEIIYRDIDAHRVDELTETILKVNPCFLATFGLDLIDTNSTVRVIIKPYQKNLAKAAA